MDTINIGPLGIPFGPLMLLIALLLATALARWVGRGNKDKMESAVWKVFLASVITSRITFIALYFEGYRGAPLSMLDIRDGGFHVLSGVLATIVVTAWIAWRNQEARMPLVMSVVAGAAFWVGAGLFASSQGAPDVSLPDLALTKLEGGEVRLPTFIGQPTVVNLWATWCPPCRREMPVLRDAQQRYPDIAFIFANQGESAEQVQQYLTEDKLVLSNVLLDAQMQLPREMNSSVFPTTLFFNEKGVLMDRRVGELSAATLAQRLEALTGP